MRFILVTISMLSCVIGFSQKKKDRDTSSLLIQPDRIEIEFQSSSDEFHVITGDEDGLILVKETNSRRKEGFAWVFTKIDTDLEVEWERVFLIPYGKTLRGWDYFGEKYYFLFSDAQYKPEDLLVFEVEGGDGAMRTMEITTVFPVQLAYFEVVDKTIILGGSTNYRPVIITYHVDEQKPRVLPGIYDNNTQLLDVIIDDDARVFSVIVMEKMQNKKLTTRVKTFTAEGLLIQNNIVNPGDRLSLIDGASTIFENGFQYVAGAYSRKSSRYSRGLYLAKFVNGRQQFVKYHNYADLDNFFGYLNKRRERRIKDRIDKRKALGKKNRFSYQLLVHKIIERDDDYVMVAEAYYPRYSSYTPYAPGGYAFSPFSSGTTRSFLGYKYTHAIVVGFDRNGNIIWDHSFEIEDALTFTQKEFVTVSTFEDKIVLLYLEENEIRSKVIRGSEILEGQTFNPVRLTYASDELKSKNPELEDLTKWYDDTMIAYGIQNIVSTNTGTKSSRKIFYINKIQYHQEGSLN
ncbi:MAG: hypothetical protein KI790_07675 [Cyclobacteriaceae bacterium]|nr:hypothetical protein [Cyclobacteriaceae bacterium HetDA_MAG_MS6]